MYEDAWLEEAYEDRCSGFVGRSEDEGAQGDDDEPYMAAVRATSADGGWVVVDEDGDEIAGPFPELRLAERWMERH